MNKNVLKIVILIALFISILVYGWGLLQKLSYNRLVFETNVYDHVPYNAKAVVNFSRNYHFEEYFELDTTNMYLLEPIKEFITYPLVIVKFEEGEDLLLMKATKEQEESIKQVFHDKIAPYHAPKVKKYENAELMFYSLPNNDFIISTFYRGIFAISKDYMQIQNFVTSNSPSNFFENSNAQQDNCIKKTRENAATSLFIHSDSTTFALTYHKKDSILHLEGEYFGKLQTDSLKMSYNEINHLLQLEGHYTDSVFWSETNKIQIWINKLD